MEKRFTRHLKNQGSKINSMEKKFKNTLTQRNYDFYVMEKRFKKKLNDAKLADNYTWEFELRKRA